MSFQFKCPQGHLLEGDPSQAGQQCNCPTCGMLFIIPAPLHPADPSAGHSSVADPPGAFDPASLRIPTQAAAFSPSDAPQPGGLASSGFAPQSAPAAQSGSPAFDAAAATEPDLLHIPCPNGHELETPRDMLGQDVLCPYCEAQFRLREKDSVEFKRRREVEIEQRERRRSRAWFNWAIVAVVLVAMGIAFLIFSSSG